MSEKESIKLGDRITVWWAWHCHTEGTVIHIPTGPGDWWHITTDKGETLAINPSSQNVDAIYKLNPRPEYAKRLRERSYSASGELL